MFIFKTLSRITLMLVFLTGFPAFGVGQQLKDRLLDQVIYKDQPVEIVAVKVKGAPIKPKQKIAGDKDWLKGLTVSVKNVSDQPVSYISVLVGAPFIENGERILATTLLQYGEVPMYPDEPPRSPNRALRKPVPPGETAELTLVKEHANELFSLLQTQRASTDITELSVRLYQVFFLGDDNKTWHTGRYYSRDPDDGWHWIPVDTPGSWKQPDQPKFMPMKSFWRPKTLDIEPDPDIPLCTLRDGGFSKVELCTARDSGGQICVWDNYQLYNTGNRNTMAEATIHYCNGNPGNFCTVSEGHADSISSPQGCKPTTTSPIVIDVAGDGIELTDNATGVRFDLNSNGVPEKLSWTSFGSDDG